MTSSDEYTNADLARDLVEVYPLFDRMFRFPPDALWMKLERIAAMKRLFMWAKREVEKEKMA